MHDSIGVDFPELLERATHACSYTNAVSDEKRPERDELELPALLGHSHVSLS